MADEENQTGKESKNGGENRRSLEDFVTENYQKQKEEGKFMATDEIDEKRTADFFSRALGESRRMNTEAEKSKKKLEDLHTELGSHRIAAWQAEHAAEVLTPEQMKQMGFTEHQ